MAPSRRVASLEIFEDPTASHGSYRHDSYPQNRSTLQPLKNGSIATNVILDPPMPEFSYSPEKQSPDSSPQPQPRRTDLFDSIHFQPTENSAFPGSPTKKPVMYATDVSQYTQKPPKALFSTFTSNAVEKENVHAFYGDMAVPKSDPPYGAQNLLKRGLDGSGAVFRRSHKKQKKPVEESSDPVEIPDPKDLPVPKDDGLKPNHSYAQLIGMAILRSPNRRLTLAQIYKWISDTFKFYDSKDTGWMNSIRHNLSLNKAFIKQERPKDDPGKGNYWALKPGTEIQFVKDKPGRRSTNPEGGTFFNHLPGDSSRPSTAPALGVFVLPPKPVRPVDSSKFPSEQELSSDATLPASDADYHEDDRDTIQMPPPSSRITHSSPPQHIHSSPPVPSLARSRVTSPNVARFPAAGPRKKRSSSFRDSGFFSSIESSVPRVGHHSFDADIDRSAIKRGHNRGRAEEEIARIRSSSFDSPIKHKPRPTSSATLLPTSSPLHSDNTFQIPPLTPGTRFEPPPRKPPPSASPNTHLRNHRDAIRDFVGTPTTGLLPPSAPNTQDHPAFSSMFSIRDDSHHSPGFEEVPTDCSIHQDDIFNAYDISLWYRGSPIKHSARQQRPMLHRATTTAGVLADITGLTQNNSRLASPFHLSATFKPANKMTSLTGSPNKRMSPDFSHPDDDENIFDGVDLGSDASADADGGLDIFKGFSKIGADANAPHGKENERHKPPAAAVKASRPVPGRSVTSIF